MITTLTTALVLSGSVALAEPSLRDDLESTLSGMAASALAADRDGYLEHIWQGEPTLYQEHWAWAKDIERIAPDVLIYELMSEPVREGDEAFADLRITWNTENWTGANRVIDLPVRFVHEDGTWYYADRDWEEKDGDGVRILYVAGLEDSADRALEIWPDIKESIEEGFARELDHPQVIKMYTSMPELQFSIFPAYVEPLGGWNEPMESIKLVGRSFSRRHLKEVVGHEYAHAMMFAVPEPEVAVERAHAVPWWVHEGIAEFAAQGFTPNRGRSQFAVEHWLDTGELRDWEDLTDFYTVDPAHYSQVYTQGRHMVGYIDETFGVDARREMMESLMHGMTLDEASEHALGESFAAVDEQWRASIAQSLAERRAREAEEKARKEAEELKKGS
ncbi:MAG: peptidase MA family metallohydrolase [Phycisphaerales bacterium JB061]